MTIRFSHVRAIVLRQFYLIRDNPTRFFQMFVWLVLDIVLWGFISKYLSTVAGISTLAVGFLGAILLYDFLIRAMQGVTGAFFEDVWSRNFLNIFGAPLSNLEYIGGLVLASICSTAFVFVILVVFATAAFGVSLFVYGVYLLPFLLVLFLFGITLGILGVALVVRFGPPAEWFVWPIPAILSPFVGTIYPIAILPTWMQVVSKALPPSYVFEGMRAVVKTGTFDAGSLLVATLLSLLYLVGMYLFFIRMYRRALKSGLFVRYSAESTT